MVYNLNQNLGTEYQKDEHRKKVYTVLVIACILLIIGIIISLFIYNKSSPPGNSSPTEKKEVLFDKTQENLGQDLSTKEKQDLIKMTQTQQVKATSSKGQTTQTTINQSKKTDLINLTAGN